LSEYSRAIATATRLIAKKGRDVTLSTVTKTGTAYNPYSTKATQTVKAVQVSFTKDERDQGLVASNSKVYLVDSVVPILKSMTITDGLEMAITSVSPLKPGDDVILYRVIANG